MSKLREKLIRNVRDVPLETSGRAPLYDGARSGAVAGPRAGTMARKLGAGFDSLPPGKRSCPYHFHYAQEEMFVVLEGEGTLRVAGEMVPICAGDVIDIPPGPEYAIRQWARERAANTDTESGTWESELQRARADVEARQPGHERPQHAEPAFRPAGELLTKALPRTPSRQVPVSPSRAGRRTTRESAWQLPARWNRRKRPSPRWSSRRWRRGSG